MKAFLKFYREDKVEAVSAVFCLAMLVAAIGWYASTIPSTQELFEMADAHAAAHASK